MIGLIARCRVRSAIRALIGLMVYSFARIGVGLGMMVEDTQGRARESAARPSFTTAGAMRSCSTRSSGSRFSPLSFWVRAPGRMVFVSIFGPEVKPFGRRVKDSGRAARICHQSKTDQYSHRSRLHPVRNATGNLGPRAAAARDCLRVIRPSNAHPTPDSNPTSHQECVVQCKNRHFPDGRPIRSRLAAF